MSEDPAMTKVRERFKKSGLSLHDLGVRMEYPPKSARKSAWQFMRTSDPRIGSLRRFSKAMGISLRTLLAEKRGNDDG